MKNNNMGSSSAGAGGAFYINGGTMKEISLYIHIPFCRSKCYYCDFLSFSNIDHRIGDYINSLIIELGLYKEILQDYKITTIFIGGGTPSYIDGKYIYNILDFIYRNFNLSQAPEISMEGNPGLSKDEVNIYKDAGINRFSMGVQTFNDELLKTIGRTQRIEDFYNSYNLLRQANINNINIDLIFGLPNQKISHVIDSLKQAIELDMEHISYYGLILEENTHLYDLVNGGRLTLPNEDDERRMYHDATDYLINNGYKHYEISNYANPGFECKHNLVYWDLLPYIGIGLNSHSNFLGKRFWNKNKLSEYIEDLNSGILPIAGEEIVDRQTEIVEFCILGIRKISGIDKIQFKNRFALEIEDIYKGIIKKHEDSGLIINSPTNIKLTKRGLDLSNLVEVDFLK